jgi:hypothetical protein
MILDRRAIKSRSLTTKSARRELAARLAIRRGPAILIDRGRGAVGAQISPGTEDRRVQTPGLEVVIGLLTRLRLLWLFKEQIKREQFLRVPA